MEFDETYRQLMSEMARPVTGFRHDQTMNSAYAILLGYMRKYGETNAATFAAWEYIWLNLPEEVKTEQESAEKKRLRTDNIKGFIRDFLIRHQNSIDKNELIDAMTNEDMVRTYVTRTLAQRGNRALGKARETGLPPSALDFTQRQR
jgi:hypothetical protein